MSTPRTSLQLYSVNTPMEADLNGTLARLSEIGFTTVEGFNFVGRAPELAAAFANNGLEPATGHAFLASTTIPRPDGVVMTPPTHAETFEAAGILGMRTVIDPFVSPDRWTTKDDIEATAALLNSAAVEAKQHGIRVGYHNHGHELSSMIDGRHALEVLADFLDPEVVLEVDLYWAAVGGADVPALLGRLGSRVVAVHVKDGLLESDDAMVGQVPAGQGKVPLGAALDAATSAEFAVIEFDRYDGDVLDAVAQSYAYLAERVGA